MQTDPPEQDLPDEARGWLWRHRGSAQALCDALCMALAIVVATVLRYEFAVPASARPGLLRMLPIAAGVFLAIASMLGLYTRRWSYGSVDEVVALGKAVAITTAVLVVLDATILDHLVPIGACIGAGPTALLAMGLARYSWRLSDERRRRPTIEGGSTPVIVFGAGEGGEQTITALLRDPHSPWFPVAMLDDDPRLSRRAIRNVRVVGGREALADVSERTGARTLVIAIPSAGRRLIRELCDLAEAEGMRVFVLPPVSELLGSPVGVADIHPLTEADLLGRREVQTDMAAIAGYLHDRRVLVTGAGGSIGSELCRQVSAFEPSSLIMLDRDESALHAVQLSIDGRAQLDTRDLVVCDIRDPGRIDEVFQEHRPEVVFHAAALKHLPLLEMHPSEAVKTNVLGTVHLLDAAERHGVDRFVNISTDKAADPVSVLGYSKRIAERLTAAVGHDDTQVFVSVRFGNVLGSRGSVLTTFKSQVASGGPVTVTHPDVTRYFMTVEEAVQLVIHGGAIGGAGEVLVLDMGEPVRIEHVAQRLIAQSESSIEIVYTGLRSGEKLHETLFGRHELGERRTHPLVSHVDVPPLHAPQLAPVMNGRGGDLREVLEALSDAKPPSQVRGQVLRPEAS